jgi:probable F420-dependent oxidoreductase
MQYGITIWPTDETLSIIELARAVESQGIESLWLPEHTHIPVKRETPYPGNAELTDMYWRGIDPFLGLAAAAAVTTDLMLGTAVSLVVVRDPIITAKEVASVDRLSGGRFLFGVGAGWNLEEIRNHGTDPAERWGVLRERILAMKAIWGSEEAEFHGRFVDFELIRCGPKPVQQPHPPVIIGGNGPGTFDRVIEFGDGWGPTAAQMGGVGTPFEERVVELRARLEAAGRPPLPVTVFGVRPLAEDVDRYQRAGADRVVFRLLPGPAHQVEEEVARIGEFCRTLSARSDHVGQTGSQVVRLLHIKDA